MSDIRPAHDTEDLVRIIIDTRFSNPKNAHEADYRDAQRLAVNILSWMEAGQPSF